MVAEAFFTEVHEADPVRRSGVGRSQLAFKVYDKDRMVLGKQGGGGPPTWRLLLAFVRVARALTCSALARSTARGSRPQATRWRTLARRWRWRSSSSRRSGFPTHCFHDRDVAPEGEPILRVPLRPRRVGRRRRAIPAADRRPVAVGARQTCSPTRAIRAAQPDEPGTPRSSRTRRRTVRKRHARDHPAPGRTKLRAMGRPRGLRPRGRPIARSFVRPGAG